MKENFVMKIIYINAGRMNPQEETKFFEFMEDIWKFLDYLKKSDYIVTFIKVWSLKEVSLN